MSPQKKLKVFQIVHVTNSGQIPFSVHFSNLYQCWCSKCPDQLYLIIDYQYPVINRQIFQVSMFKIKGVHDKFG